ncbi:hypothetical protein [Leptospira wolffii]|uniref:hypothetical protein n=1 Tax=Leptospira wolffii TaxID=409998 RepID=UPI0012EBDB4B|nr:hypothetical protein [Leptospira wolffii]
MAGSLHEQHWIAKYYLGDSVKKISSSIAYPAFGIINILTAIVLYLSNAKYKVYSIVFLVVPRFLNGITILIIDSDTDTTLSILAMFELLFVVIASRSALN